VQDQTQRHIAHRDIAKRYQATPGFGQTTATHPSQNCRTQDTNVLRLQGNDRMWRLGDFTDCVNRFHFLFWD
jgi:hypothetical protein